MGDQGSAFNEIPLIVLPRALLVSYIQNSPLLFEHELVSNCLDLSFYMLTVFENFGSDALLLAVQQRNLNSGWGTLLGKTHLT